MTHADHEDRGPVRTDPVWAAIDSWRHAEILLDARTLHASRLTERTELSVRDAKAALRGRRYLTALRCLRDALRQTGEADTAIRRREVARTAYRSALIGVRDARRAALTAHGHLQ